MAAGNAYLGIFKDRFRYFILLLALFCLTAISSNMLTFNFAVLCMNLNATEYNANVPTYEFTPKEETLIMWALGLGSLLGTFPFTYLFTKFGTKYIFIIAGTVSVLSTVATPTSLQFGFYPFLFVRFIQGISYAADFAAIGLLTSIWASLKQHALFLSVLTSYSPLSSTLTNIFSGYVCDSFLGWPFIYYFHGIAGAALFTYWFIMYTDTPAESKWVSAVELEKIERNKGEEELQIQGAIPYFEICKSPVVLAVWLNALTEITSSIFLLTYTPIYINKVHKFSVEATGLISSVPSTTAIVLRMAFGYVSDKITFWEERTKINVFNTLSTVGPAICYMAIVFFGNSVFDIMMLVMINVFYSFSGGGFYKCATLSCRQYSHFVIANIQFIKCLTLFLAPAIYGYFVEDEDAADQWDHMFIFISVVLIISGFIFVFVSTDQPLAFTKSHEAKKESRRLTVDMIMDAQLKA
ncbi:unnamed protein product [Bursaphelenchus okinawaensis]|uniref:Major facilitator superfamily (MFS) profile domain-containing protein n=1 Tax=Bursaphelenchus okinawaensis TaxID=465554 RepID=A0A811KYY4_9BILA|nr:unnamed protein product [Bursaphelenchus okinawaensis]CAG9114830.1 unnamed protein product [Bursaphelenchus okinawaensis]